MGASNTVERELAAAEMTSEAAFEGLKGNWEGLRDSWEGLRDSWEGTHGPLPAAQKKRRQTDEEWEREGESHMRARKGNKRVSRGEWKDSDICLSFPSE